VTDLTIGQLTEQMHAFVESKGWYAPDSVRPQSARNLAVSLAIEAAEVLEHVQWRDSPADTEAMAEELADVMLYLLQLAGICGINLTEAVLDKLDTNAQREWPLP